MDDCAPLQARLWKQEHGSSGFPSGISPAKVGLWNVIERFTMSIVGFLRDRKVDILVGNEVLWLTKMRPGPERTVFPQISKYLYAVFET